MKMRIKLLISLLLAVSVSVAHAATYSVAAEFEEYLTLGQNTFFNGTFEWDGVSVTNLHGTMNSSMYPVDPTYQNGFPLMSLSYQLDGTHASGDIVTASVFLKNTTDVYRGGGYDGVASEFIKYGGDMDSVIPALPGETPNENAFFTLAFDKTNMKGVVVQMVYGDCTPGGLMHSYCMAGESTGTSPMFATPLSLNIALVPIDAAPVPLPAAAWMFLSALMGFLGLKRRQRSV